VAISLMTGRSPPIVAMPSASRPGGRGHPYRKYPQEGESARPAATLGGRDRSQAPVKTWHEPIGEPTIAGSICDRLVHAPPRTRVSLTTTFSPCYVSLDGASGLRLHGGGPARRTRKRCIPEPRRSMRDMEHLPGVEVALERSPGNPHAAALRRKSRFTRDRCADSSPRASISGTGRASRIARW
jgi:hypothetical protein